MVQCFEKLKKTYEHDVGRFVLKIFPIFFKSLLVNGDQERTLDTMALKYINGDPSVGIKQLHVPVYKKMFSKVLKCMKKI